MQYDMVVDASVRIKGTVRVSAEDDKEAYPLALEYVEEDLKNALFLAADGPENTRLKLEVFEGYIAECIPVDEDRDKYPDNW